VSIMKFLVLLILAVFTADCNANIVQNNQPAQQLDMVKNAFWDYVSKVTFTAEESLEKIKQSELGQEVNTLISESTDAVDKLSAVMRDQMAPLTQDLITKLSQEAEQLKTRVETELNAMSAQLKPYAEQLSTELQRQVETLGRDVTPYAEAMDTDALRAALLQKTEQLKASLDKSMTELKTQVVPYAEEIKEKIDQSLEEFQRGMIPMAEMFQSQLAQKTQELQQNMAPYGEELRRTLDIKAQNVNEQLVALWRSFTKMAL